MLETHSSEGKPTTGESSRVRNLLPPLLHHIGLDELVPEVRGVHVQAMASLDGWFLDNGVNTPPSFPSSPLPLHLNCPSDSAGRAPHAHPTLVQLEGPTALGFFSGDLFGDFSGRFRGH